MNPYEDEQSRQRLSWYQSDIEQRFGFHGGRYTRVNMFFTFLLATLATVLFYTGLYFIPENWFTQMFTARGITPYPTVFLGFWVAFILWVKVKKIKLQRLPLSRSIVPEQHNFVLTPATADSVLTRIQEIADNPRDFLLFNRIIQTLSNLRNIGKVSDVDDILRSRAEQAENSMETTYTMLNGFLWAIPILGFIGTVLGLSAAIGNFGSVLTADADTSQLIPTLKQVTGGLATAFETTLIALVIALFLQLWATSVKKSEEEFLDDCSEYCSNNIVSRLRIDYHTEQH
ncbi:MAG: MotA/TolQ/ExbB proton channel family protein [Planctomycetia bacterium]|nr:MotA/TolQ/ExbB proton channel family protein [Planctomycetia bacterium]